MKKLAFRPIVSAFLVGVMFWASVGCGLAGGAEPLVSEQFDTGETGPWLTESDAMGFTAVRDGRLLIGIDSPSTMQFSTLQEPILSDFTMEVEAVILEGLPSDSYGILFRLQDNLAQSGGYSFYRFAVTGDGFYLVERRNPDGTVSSLTDDWEQTSSIQQGVGVSNLLGVAANGMRFGVYANGTLLGAFTDESLLSQGKIALAAGAFGRGGLRVAFDKVVVTD